MQDGSQINCEWLLSPLSESEFFTDYWGRKPLYMRRKNGKYYEGVLSISDVDELISSARVRPDNIRIVRGQSHVPHDKYVSNDGFIDPIEALRYFDQGHTVVLEQMHLYQGGLRRLCDRLAGELGFRLQTNLYLTPALSQGFDLHYDTHDVFILQIYGEKRWAIHESPILLPLPGQTYEQCELGSGDEKVNCVLAPGDLLYIPRGYFHSATSLDHPSLHITLGALTKTWTDILLEAVALACAENPEFRESMPVRLFTRNADPSLQKARSHFSTLWERLSDRVDFEEVIGKFSADAARERRPENTGHLKRVAGLQNLKRGSIVKARSVPIKWSIDEHVVKVIAFEKEISFPSYALNELQDLLSYEEFRVEDVGDAVDIEGKLTLTRRLILEGLLEVIQF